MNRFVFQPPKPATYTLTDKMTYIDASSTLEVKLDDLFSDQQVSNNPSTPAFKLRNGERVSMEMQRAFDGIAQGDKYIEEELASWRVKSYKLRKTVQQSNFVRTHRENISIVEVPAGGGTICCLFFEHPKSRGITLIYSHGNAEDLGLLAQMFKEMSKCVWLVRRWGGTLLS